MKDIFFVWQGGEGGDFIMSILARFFDKNYNILPMFEYGRAVGPEQFKTKNFNFFKSHKLWNDINYKQSTNRFVFFVVNPDIDLMLRKKFKKILLTEEKRSNYDLLMSNHKVINQKMIHAMKKKDFKSAYYYGHQSHLTSYLNYKKTMYNMIKDLPHKIINTKLILYEDVVDVCSIIAQTLNIKINLDSDAELYCRKYIESQQEFLESWPYCKY